MTDARTTRVVALISGRGSNLQAIVDGMTRGELPIELVAVISNRPDAQGLQRAAEAGIRTAVVPHTDYADRDAYDRALAATIESFAPDLVLLAGFMRILGERFVVQFKGRMLNIHPSLLPKYRGLHTHQRALDAGDKIHGATVHFVTPDLDAGPMIVQACVPVLPDDDETSLAARVLAQEHRIYPLAVSLFAAGRIELRNDQVLMDSNPLQAPILVEG